MATYPSVAVALDKGKLDSPAVYVALLEVDLIDPETGLVAATEYFAHNDEPFVHRGQSYPPVGFDFDVKTVHGELPSFTLTLNDPTLLVQGALQEYSGATDSTVRIKIVTTLAPDVVEMEETFTVLSAKANAETYQVEFTLGSENPLVRRFPQRMMFRNRCFWKYKGAECGYTGALPSCDFTLYGDNGCKVHSNAQRFGGFPGIRRRNF